MTRLLVAKLGQVEYCEALALQEKINSARVENQIPDTLLLLEHPGVITLGRRGKRANILASEEYLEDRGIRVIETSRGGDVTYHGPGQLVGYPVISLRERGHDIRRFVSGIEEAIAGLLDGYGIRCSCELGGYTGVWVGNRKIAAIGIAVKRWVTMHGFALNVNTDIGSFSLINPCGITDRGVTSLEKLVGRKEDMDAVADKVAALLCEVFGAQGECVTRSGLEEMLGGHERSNTRSAE